MKSAVIDANVVIKWIFPEEERHPSQSIYLLHVIKKGNLKIFQPPHWLAEVAEVVVRLQPSIAKETVDLLYALEFPVLNEPEIYQLACKLSEQFNHHLFDTLYHATALYGGCTFITADDKYYRKGSKMGGILRLSDFLSA